MTEFLRVNHDGLAQIADQAVSTANKINDRLNQLEGELNQLRSDWEGEQQQAYVVAKAQWDQAIEGMVEMLEATAQAVHQANDGYRQADQRGQARFGG